MRVLPSEPCGVTTKTARDTAEEAGVDARNAGDVWNDGLIEAGTAQGIEDCTA
jgi:hypothetical protein